MSSRKESQEGNNMHGDNSGNSPAKKYFVLKLIPPRPTFAEDMTNEEKAIMKQHAAYWKVKADHGVAIVYEPVLDPKGVYGLGIIEVDNEDQARAFCSRRPDGQIRAQQDRNPSDASNSGQKVSWVTSVPMKTVIGSQIADLSDFTPQMQIFE